MSVVGTTGCVLQGATPRRPTAARTSGPQAAAQPLIVTSSARPIRSARWLPLAGGSQTCRGGRRPRNACMAASSADGSASGSSEVPFGVLPSGFIDYYEILQIDDDADLPEIKSAYRSLAKVCHPDFLGDDGHNICILLNEAYETLSDDTRRAAYNYELEQALLDDDDGYTGETLSKWCANTRNGRNEDPTESRGVFVDENACIGCKMCVWCANATFRIEPEYGRSRVFGQWLDTEDDIQAAIDACPVSCISWVEKEDLPALEFVMQNKCERVDVGVMMAGQGGAVDDPFQVAAKFLKDRAEREEKVRKARSYSPAQQEARRKAVEEMMKANMGWFAGAMQGFIANNMVRAPRRRDEGAVGQRRRSKRWDDTYSGENGATIPPERALVLANVEDDR